MADPAKTFLEEEKKRVTCVFAAPSSVLGKKKGVHIIPVTGSCF
jgi:hypothetical protein